MPKTALPKIDDSGSAPPGRKNSKQIIDAHGAVLVHISKTGRLPP
jgi:hypothetical protein